MSVPVILKRSTINVKAKINMLYYRHANLCEILTSQLQTKDNAIEHFPLVFNQPVYLDHAAGITHKNKDSLKFREK